MDAFLVQFIDKLILAMYIALLGRVLISWFRIGQDSPFYPIITILYQITEPILAPIRRVLPSFGMLDLSPMVALFLLAFIQRTVNRLL